MTADELIGKNLDGRFLVRELITTGTSCNVYKAFQPLMHRTVAIKVLSENVIDLRVAEQRLRREVLATSKLDHVGICKIRANGVLEDSRPYLVMDWQDGTTLAELIQKNGGMQWHQAKPILEQLCDILAYIHRQGIVHNNVKPSHVFISKTEEGVSRVTLLDFGSSADFAEDERQPTEGDLFSCGCIMYELLSGAPPFKGNTVLGTLHKQIHEKPEALPQTVPAKLRSIVMRCLEKNPNKRYQSAEELQTAIKSCKSEGEKATSETNQPFWRSKTLRTTLAIATACAVLGMLVVVLLGYTPPSLNAVAQAILPNFPQTQRASMLISTAKFYANLGNPRASNQLYLKAAEQVYPQNDEATIRLRLQGAQALKRAGLTTDAINQYRSIVESIARSLDTVSPEPAVTQLNTSDKGIAIAIDLALAGINEFPKDTSSWGSNFAQTCKTLVLRCKGVGQLDTAISIMQRGLAARRLNARGQSSFDLAADYREMGLLYWYKAGIASKDGDLNTARKLMAIAQENYREAVNIYESTQVADLQAAEAFEKYGACFDAFDQKTKANEYIDKAVRTANDWIERQQTPDAWAYYGPNYRGILRDAAYDVAPFDPKLSNKLYLALVKNELSNPEADKEQKRNDEASLAWSMLPIGRFKDADLAFANLIEAGRASDATSEWFIRALLGAASAKYLLKQYEPAMELCAEVYARREAAAKNDDYRRAAAALFKDTKEKGHKDISLESMVTRVQDKLKSRGHKLKPDIG